MAKDKDRVLSAFERAVQYAIGNGQQLGSESDPLRDRCPLLWAWLSAVFVGKEYQKSPASLNFRLGPDCAHAVLSDRDLCTSLEVTAQTVDALFPALEAALASSSPPIKTWGKREPRLRRRRGV